MWRIHRLEFRFMIIIQIDFSSAVQAVIQNMYLVKKTLIEHGKPDLYRIKWKLKEKGGFCAKNKLSGEIT